MGMQGPVCRGSVLGAMVAAACVLIGTPALAGKAEFYVEIAANNVESVKVATSPGAAQQHNVVHGQARQFKLASIETTDDKTEQTVQPGAHFMLYLTIQGFMSNLSCEVKSPTVPVTIVNNGGDAFVKTKVNANANGCQIEKTTCSGAACKTQG